MINRYDKIAQATGVDRESVKRVLLAANYMPSIEDYLQNKIKSLEDQLSRLQHSDTTGK